MPVTSIGFVVFVVCALTLFAGALGWASWEEGRNARRARN
jgi:hypothetical protein